jgi:hypothetical protein
MRFHAGTGFLYTGDYSTESVRLYAFDPLPKSRTVLFDCSYGETTRRWPSGKDDLAPYLAAMSCCRRRPTAAARTSRSHSPAPRTIHLDDATRDARARSDRDCARLPARRCRSGP